MPTNVDNWLTRRGAGALFNLQRTPYVAGTDAITANPKKTQANQVHAHTRQYLTNWPASSVFKISGTGLTINGLELETKYTYSFQWASAWQDNADGDIYLASIVEAAQTSIANANIAPVKWPAFFGGSDFTLYTTADWVANEHFQEDKDGDGVLEDYYNVYEASITGIQPSLYSTTPATYLCSGNVSSYQTSPVTKSTTIPLTSGQFPEWTAYVDFGTTPFYAPDHFASETQVYGPNDGASFCPRSSDDSPHGLSAYVDILNNVPSITNPLMITCGVIGSYRHAPTDSPSGECAKYDCECKFFYTPDACDDCWYAGKVITIEITYKKIPFIDNGPTIDGVQLSKSVTMGSATTHSTITKTLTLPTGLTRQQVGSTFTVPTLAGYAVVIDDIKLVSVS